LLFLLCQRQPIIMEIFLWRDGAQFGPYFRERVQELLDFR
jgi:hypothetical protein